MNRRGLTLMELMIVIALIGLLAAIGYPRLAETALRNNVRAAARSVVTMHAKAKATAVNRGRPSFLVFSANTVGVIAQNPVSGAFEWVVPRLDLNSRYGVNVRATRTVFRFDPRGIGIEPNPSMVEVSRAQFADTVRISSIGRIEP